MLITSNQNLRQGTKSIVNLYAIDTHNKNSATDLEGTEKVFHELAEEHGDVLSYKITRIRPSSINIYTYFEMEVTRESGTYKEIATTLNKSIISLQNYQNE